jgi:3-phenylpropionate/trans-cinnamate dioxygenase ferredoxin subunit
MTDEWFDACGVEDIDEEDVLSFDHKGQAIAIYRSPEGTFHATDGICTHEHANLADGLVVGDLIECPKHNGRFDYKTGRARRAPACVDLRIYPVKVQDGRVLIRPSR